MTSRLLYGAIAATLVVGCGGSESKTNSRQEAVTTPTDDPRFSGEWQYALTVPTNPTPETGPELPLPRRGPEIPCNGVDEDGDGYDFCLGDADGDGVPAPLDCNDLNPNISPIAPEIRCDGIDQNCDGIDQCDRDQDGIDDAYDCNPDDPAITNECWPKQTPGDPL